jgi:hypothetical protein
MADFSIRRQAALDALTLVVSGASARDVESETVDFKEEAGTIVAGQRRSISPRHDRAAEALADEVACFARSTILASRTIVDLALRSGDLDDWIHVSPSDTGDVDFRVLRVGH